MDFIDSGEVKNGIILKLRNDLDWKMIKMKTKKNKNEKNIKIGRLKKNGLEVRFLLK